MTFNPDQERVRTLQNLLNSLPNVTIIFNFLVSPRKATCFLLEFDLHIVPLRPVIMSGMNIAIRTDFF